MSAPKTIAAPPPETRGIGLLENLARAQATFRKWPAWKQNYQPTKQN